MPTAVLYQLAAKSTPEPVRKEIVAKLEQGEGIPPEIIVERVREAREAEREARVEASKSPERHT